MSSAISSSSSASAPVSTATAPAASSAQSASALVTSQGIGSGLNIGAIVTALTSAYGAAQTNELTNQKNSLNAQVSAFGTFSSALSTLQATLTTLQTPGSLAGFAATVGDKTIATASASSTAVAGTYSLEVNNLAAAASLTSAAESATTAVGTGTLQIQVGTASTSISIDNTNNTLSGIAAAINGAAGNPGVTASVITTTGGQRLVLSGTSTGAANAITVTQSGGDGGLAALTYDPVANTGGLTQTQAAQDASFSINGYAATSPTNLVSGAISGVTLNLLQASAANTPTTLSIAPDSTAAQTSVGTFVSALNGVLTAIQNLTAYDPTTQTAGPLNGNATLQSFQNQLQNILGQLNSGGSSGLHSLSDLGITANAQGTYDTNTTTLGNELSGNFAAVAGFLGGTNGLATQIANLVNNYVEPGGLLSTITDGLQTGLSNVAKQQTALTAQLAIYSATLTTQYNAMDAAVAALKQTQTYLTAEFNPNSSTSSSSSSSNSSLSSGTTSTSNG
jgi:flagellar hook-associated protein 2